MLPKPTPRATPELHPRSYLNRLLLFHEGNDFFQVIDHGLQLGDGFGGKVLRFGKIVGIVEGVVLDPVDIELVVPFLDRLQGEAVEAFALGAGGEAIRIGTIALLKLGEVGGSERSILLSDTGHIRACVEDPSLRCRATLL